MTCGADATPIVDGKPAVPPAPEPACRHAAASAATGETFVCSCLPPAPERNQCDGCAAGHPLNEHGHHEAPYPSGGMVCQAYRYAPPAPLSDAERNELARLRAIEEEATTDRRYCGIVDLDRLRSLSAREHVQAPAPATTEASAPAMPDQVTVEQRPHYAPDCDNVIYAVNMPVARVEGDRVYLASNDDPSKPPAPFRLSDGKSEYAPAWRIAAEDLATIKAAVPEPAPATVTLRMSRAWADQIVALVSTWNGPHWRTTDLNDAVNLVVELAGALRVAPPAPATVTLDRAIVERLLYRVEHSHADLVPGCQSCADIAAVRRAMGGSNG